jgi:hypothetical protein
VVAAAGGVSRLKSRGPGQRVKLARGCGQGESNAAEHDQRDNDPACDRKGAATARSMRGPRRGQGLEPVHQSARPNPRGPIFIGVSH